MFPASSFVVFPGLGFVTSDLQRCPMARRKRIKTDGCNHSIMSVSPFKLLSEDLISEILKRLPAIPLMRFQCVCKDWMRLIQDPLFAEAHLSFFQARPEASSSYTLLFAFGKGVLATHWKLVPRNWPVPANRHLFRKHIPCSNIVNGLICLRNGSRLSIYNLSTGEKRDLPPTRIRDHDTRFALGFDSVSKKYKLLLFRGDLASEILTMGRKSFWKDLQDVPEMIELRFNPIYVAGKIYFIEQRPFPSQKFFIRFFDLTSEKFGTIDPPSYFDALHLDPFLVEAGGNLGLLAKDFSRDLNERTCKYGCNFWVLDLDLNWVERSMFWIHHDNLWGSILTVEILCGLSVIRLFDPETSRWRKEKINDNDIWESHTCTHISCCNNVENILPLSSMD